MTEHTSFERRLSGALDRYADGAPARLDALELAEHIATTTHRGRWGSMIGAATSWRPRAPRLGLVGGSALAAVVLAAAGIVIIVGAGVERAASVGSDGSAELGPVEAVSVKGRITSPELQDDDFQATVERDGLYVGELRPDASRVITVDFDDDRLDGTLLGSMRMAFVGHEPDTLMIVSGDVRIENDGGAWVGQLLGAGPADAVDEVGDSVPVFTLVGTGDYEGLRTVLYSSGSEPVLSTGVIFSADLVDSD